MPRRKSTGRSRSKGRSKGPLCVPARRTVKLPSKLSARRRLPAQVFALPEERRYPLPDAYHATLALSFLVRVAGRHGPRPEEARKVLSAVRHYWPDVYKCEADLVAEAKRRNKVRLVPAFRGPSKGLFSQGLPRATGQAEQRSQAFSRAQVSPGGV